MADYTVAGVLIAIFGLIWSNKPFLCLILALASFYSASWGQEGILIGAYLIASLAGSVYGGLTK